MDIKLSIRPEIKTIDQTKNSTNQEIFQNKTLRPILKIQHQLFGSFFKAYLEKRKTKWSSYSEKQKEDYISGAFSNDNNFKNAITHLVIGHFTTEEFSTFNDNSKEFKKRILQMAKQRVLEQFV